MRESQDNGDTDNDTTIPKVYEAREESDLSTTKETQFACSNSGNLLWKDRQSSEAGSGNAKVPQEREMKLEQLREKVESWEDSAEVEEDAGKDSTRNARVNSRMLSSQLLEHKRCRCLDRQ